MKRKLVYKLFFGYLFLTILGGVGFLWFMFGHQSEPSTKDIEFYYPNWNERAVVISYDDANLTDSILIPIMNKYGLVGTFFLHSTGLNTYLEATGDSTLEMYTLHEIGGHSTTHPILPDLSLSEVQKEIIVNSVDLSTVLKRSPKSFAYPFGLYGVKEINSLKKNGFKNARTVQNTYGFERPIDWFQWHPTCLDMDYKKVVEDFFKTKSKDLKNQVISKLSLDGGAKINIPLLYLWGHSYVYEENSGVDVTWEDFEELCKSIGGKEKTWYAGAYEVQSYYLGLDNLIMTKNEVNNPPENRESIFFKIKDETIILKPGDTYKL